MTQYLTSTINLAGLMALIAFSFAGASRFVPRSMDRQIIYGMILGAGAVIISLQPIMHVNGIQIDPRNLFVGCAAAIVGPVAGLVTFIIAAYTRYYEAAPSASVCIFSLFVAGCAGLAWRHCTRNVKHKHAGHLAILGLTISLSYSSTFLLPREHWQGVFSTATPVLTIINVVGAIVLGGFLEFHRRQKEQEAILRNQASFDPLTWLMNRRAFEASYATSILPNASSGTAFIIVDLDHFKLINDTYGHAAGDRALLSISRSLRTSIREGDLSARFGGDEFVVCLPNISIRDTKRIIGRIRNAMSELGRHELDSDLDLTASFGVSWSEEPLVLEAAFGIADQSLCEAKVAGKNRTVFSDNTTTAATRTEAVAPLFG